MPKEEEVTVRCGEAKEDLKQRILQHERVWIPRPRVHTGSTDRSGLVTTRITVNVRLVATLAQEKRFGYRCLASIRPIKMPTPWSCRSVRLVGNWRADDSLKLRAHVQFELSGAQLANKTGALAHVVPHKPVVQHEDNNPVFVMPPACRPLKKTTAARAAGFTT
eukprot:3318583-Amphidinium_carterae.1